MREIQYNFDSEALESLAEVVGYAELHKTLGYLTTWNLSYLKVEIFIQDKSDLLAVYRQEGKVNYVIGAVWHDDHYGFHS